VIPQGCLGVDPGLQEGLFGQGLPYNGDMGIIAFLILGVIAGTIARILVPGRINKGLISALICGVVGALIGGWLSSSIFHISLGTFWSLRTWVIAIAGSALVLFVWGLITKKSGSANR